MGKIEDRVIRLLPVDAVEVHHAFFRQMVKHHGAGLVHRGQLGRITEQQECREDLFEVFKLFVIQHGGFIDKADVQRFFPAFPAGDEVRAAQAGCRQGAGDGFVRCIESGGAVQRLIRQPFNLWPVARACEPFGNALVFGIIDRGVEDAVDRGGRHTAQAQHAGGFVGGGEDGERALVLALAALVIARDHFDARVFQRFVELGQQQRFARPRLARDGHHLITAARGRHQQAVVQINAGTAQQLGHTVISGGLIVGISKRGGHAPVYASCTTGASEIAGLRPFLPRAAVLRGRRPDQTRVARPLPRPRRGLQAGSAPLR